MNIIKRATERLLNSHGYYKVDFPDGGKLSEADITELYKTYGGNRTYRMHLRDLCENDKDLYYIATNDEERFMIRGATQRTKYFLALINKVNDSANKQRDKEDRGKDKVLSRKTSRIEGVDYSRSKGKPYGID